MARVNAPKPAAPQLLLYISPKEEMGARPRDIGGRRTRGRSKAGKPPRSDEKRHISGNSTADKEPRRPSGPAFGSAAAAGPPALGGGRASRGLERKITRTGRFEGPLGWQRRPCGGEVGRLPRKPRPGALGPLPGRPRWPCAPGSGSPAHVALPLMARTRRPCQRAAPTATAEGVGRASQLGRPAQPSAEFWSPESVPAFHLYPKQFLCAFPAPPAPRGGSVSVCGPRALAAASACHWEAPAGAGRGSAGR